MKNQNKKLSKQIHSNFFSLINPVLEKPSLKADSRLLVLLVSILLLITPLVKAQDTAASELKVKTSAVCKMCKKTIEKALASEKGIKKSDLDVKSKIVTVTYIPSKTTPEKIRKAIADSGYDADDVPANPKAYKKLENCCKKKEIKIQE